MAINSGKNSEIAKNLEQAKELIKSMSSDTIALNLAFADIEKKVGSID